MLMQNFEMTNKEYDGMLWYFLEWSIPSHKGFSHDVTAAILVFQYNPVGVEH